MLSHEELKEKLSRYSLVTSCGCHVWLRGESGIGYGRAKLTEETALEAYKDPRSYPEIAATYGVTTTSIHLLKKGKTWQHIHS